MIELSTHKEDTTIINVYTANIRSLKYMKQIQTYLIGEIDNNTIKERDSITHF